MSAAEWALGLAESGRVPDPVLRFGIRRLLGQRLRRVDDGGAAAAREERIARQMRSGPIAPATAEANRQHYEVPAAFFETVLGPRLKYSACHWPEGVDDLAVAEEAMLALTAERAALADGMTVLDLGCGWGSLSLWLAERYPACRIVAVSNSVGQRRFIAGRRDARGLANLDVVTADVNEFDPGRRFDRVVSVEMFEHMRNYRELLRRIAGWLVPGGALFVHVFCHRDRPYFFEADGVGDWMARHFFTDGLMPSENLLRRFEEDLAVEEQWRVNGAHYEKTLLAWLARQDAARRRVLEICRATYGAESAGRWFHRWRIFFLACAELFGSRGGDEWFVAHYRLRPVAGR